MFGRIIHLIKMTGRKITKMYFLVLRGTQLLSLHAHVETPQAAKLIGTYCTQLQELKLSAWYPKHLPVELILPKAGMTLRKSVIPSHISHIISREELRVIRNHCPNLNTLRISYADGEWDYLANLLASYGEKLEFSYLPSGFSVENACTVVSNFPNVKLSVDIKGLSYAFISVLCGHVEIHAVMNCHPYICSTYLRSVQHCAR